MEVVEFRPEPEQYAFTFGGVGPVRKVTPGTVLRLWTEDAFCGNIRRTTDLPSAATSASMRGNCSAVCLWARDPPRRVDRNGLSQRKTPTQPGQYTR